jgi:hypothetical protein
MYPLTYHRYDQRLLVIGLTVLPAAFVASTL